MALKFLNKKGWHTGSLRNLETVWKAEQKNEVEKKKLEELKKQILDEREASEMRKIQEEAGLTVKEERVSFLYDAGLSTGKATAEDYLLGKPVEDSKLETDLSRTSDKPGSLFASNADVSVQSANDTWRKLHSDPLFVIKKQEMEMHSKIRSNPVKMNMIKKQADVEKQTRKEEKKKRKEVKRIKKMEKKEERKGNGKEMKEQEKEKEKRKDDDDGRERERRGGRDIEAYSKKEKERGREERGERIGGEREKERGDRKERERERGEREREREKERGEGERERKKERGKREEKRGERKERENERGGREREEREKERGERERERKRGRVEERGGRERERERETDRDKEEKNDKKRIDEPNLHPNHQPNHPLSHSHEIRSQNSHKRRKVELSEEEKKKRIEEMKENAQVHEDERWKRMVNAKKKEEEEGKKDAVRTANNFIMTTNREVYGADKGGSVSIEESVRRRKHYSQSGRDEKNAFRR